MDERQVAHQKHMLYSSMSAPARMQEAFNDMQRSSNPLTRSELEMMKLKDERWKYITWVEPSK